MYSKYVMCNVVCYDGCDSWVAKFILRNTTDTERRKDIEMMGYDAQILLIDILYDMSPENIISYLVSDDTECKVIADRYKNMYL